MKTEGNKYKPYYIHLSRKEEMNLKKEVISTQIRLPAGIYEYIKQEADKMGIAQNAFLILLLEQGRKVWEASVSIHLKE